MPGGLPVSPEICQVVRKENAEAHAAMLARLDQINGRLRTLELWQARLEGAGWATKGVLGLLVAAIGAAAGFAAAWIKART